MPGLQTQTLEHVLSHMTTEQIGDWVHRSSDSGTTVVLDTRVSHGHPAVRKGKEQILAGENRVLRFNTKSGDSYIVEPAKRCINSYVETDIKKIPMDG